MRAHELRGNGKAQAPVPPARAEPWNAWGMRVLTFSATPAPVSETSITTTLPSRRPVIRNLIARRIARTTRFQRLHRITSDIDEDAKQLIVIGFHRQAAFDRNDPADRHVKTEAKRFVHFFDQRLDLDGFAWGGGSCAPP